MNKLWPVVTSKNPCPICRKTDFCALGDRAIKCMRVESKHPSRDGGWYHDYPNEVKLRPEITPQKKVVIPIQSNEHRYNHWRVKTNTVMVSSEACNLGVTYKSLQALGIAWDDVMKAWLFPMRDGAGKIIGVRTRKPDGEKRSYLGGNNGLFIPQIETQESLCYLPEGPTDTAACLSLGLFAIGRPSANAGQKCNEYMRDALRRLNIKRAVIIADNDLGHEVAQAGAIALGKAVRLPHVIWTPHAKDMREYYKMGATKEMIESSIRQLTWRPLTWRR